MKVDLRFRFILSLVFVTAFCSYAYELVLAQILSVLWGNVVQQYTITTGIYIAAMGAGAYLTPVQINAKRSFIWVELALSVLAILSPLILVFSDMEMKPVAPLISYLAIVGIGFLSGMELPLLIRILQSESNSPDRDEKALFIDYLGMFAAGILFALFLNRQFGTLNLNLWLATGNLGLALVCGLIWGFQDKAIRRFEIPVAGIICIAIFCLLIRNISGYEEQIVKWIIAN